MLEFLHQAIKQNLLAHAYLFLGKKPKVLSEAMDLAMAVNCSALDSKLPCRACLSCRKILHGNHADIIIVEPRGSSLKIDQVREVQKKISFKHFEAKYKVVVLAGADLMTGEAANSLLKILEEPPGDTIFILGAENGDNILPTVLSRCQLIRLGKDDHEISEKTMEDRVKWCREIIDFVAGLPSMDYEQVLNCAGAWEKNKENIQELLDTLVLWLRDVMVAKATGKKELVNNQQFWMEALDCPLTATRSLFAVEEVQKSQRLINQNGNLRLVLDVLLLKLYRLAA